MVFESIIQTLVENDDHRIELRNFGVFEVKRREARKARNPRTGEKVDVPPKSVVIFKPGKRMEELVADVEGVAVKSNDDDYEEADEELVGAANGRHSGPRSGAKR